MYYEYTEDSTNIELNLQQLSLYINNITEKTLILIFSAPNCLPCKELSKSIQSIYNNSNDIKKEVVPNIIKINAELLCDNDLKYINKFPTILTIKKDILNNINMNDVLLNQLNDNKEIIKIIGLPQQHFYDQNNLIIEF